MMAIALLALLQAATDDASATAALDKFKTEYKVKEVGQRAAAVGDLAKTLHDKVIAKLSALLVVDEPYALQDRAEVVEISVDIPDRHH